MPLAAKHLDMIIGVDIHLVNIPPATGVPMPHPFIGIIFDPFDYLPFIGCNTYVNKQKCATSATGAMLGTKVHIPMGAGFTMAPTIAHDGAMFFGSSTVKVEGSNMSAGPYMIMTCSCIGMPLSVTFGKKPKQMKPSMYLPTSTSLPIPKGMPVNVNGPLVPDIMGAMTQLAMSAGLSFLGKFATRKLVNKISKHLDSKGGKFKKFGKWLRSTKCTLIGDPVDPASGRVMYPVDEFELPGVIPFKWSRLWHSDTDYNGPLGYGWSHSYDWGIELFPDEDMLVLRMEEGRHCAVPIPTPEKKIFERDERITVSEDENGYKIYNHENKLTYHFRPAKNKPANQFELTAITNKDGFTMQFFYTSGHLDQVIDSVGRRIDFKTDTKGRITEIAVEEYAGKNKPLVAYAYSEEGDMIEACDALNKATIMKYNNHLMVAKTDRNDVTFHWAYDGKSTGAKCIHTWGPEGLFEYHFEYNKGYTVVTNSLGNTTTYYYNEGGLITREINPLGAIYSKDYNYHGDIICETDPLGQNTYYGYDNDGNQTSIKSPGGKSLDIIFEDGNPVLAKNADNAVWIWEYNKDGDLESRIGPDNDVTRFKYDKGILKSITDTSGQTSVLEYDRQYNLSKLVLPDGSESTMHYDALGRLTSQTNPLKANTKLVYDKLGRVTEIRQADGNTTKLKYNAYEEVIHVRDNHHDVQFEYTPLGSLKSRTENGTKVEFKYNKEEELIAITNKEENEYRFIRDKAGYIAKEIGFDGLTRCYHRDAAGRVIQTVLPDNKILKHHYTRGGQINRIEYPDGTDELFNYDTNGMLREAINKNGRIAFERTPAGRIIKEIQNGYEVISDYNDMGQRTKVSSSLGAKLTFDYNDMGSVQKASAKQGEADWKAEMSYNAIGQEIERLLPNDVRSTWRYSDSGHPLEHILMSYDKKKRHKTYKWDVNDRLQSITDQITNGITSFNHDVFGNLASAKYADGSWDFRLPDSVGNLFRSKEKTDRTYGAAGELLESPEWRYKYDELGNLNSKISKKGAGTWRYKWTPDGMLEEVTRPDGGEVNFKYDALGRRLEKTYNKETTYWVWDGNVPLHEWKERQGEEQSIEQSEVESEEESKSKEIPKDIITWVFDEGTFRPAAKLQNGRYNSIITDYLGTPVEMYNDKGVRIWDTELDIYGSVRTLDSGSLNDCPFRYQGQYEDVETGLYYNRFRYYNPEDGCYLSQDPITLAGGNPTLYGYVFDSNKQVDPFGLINYTINQLDALAEQAHSTLPADKWYDLGNISTTAVGSDVNGNLYIASSLSDAPEQIHEWANANNITVVESGSSNVHAEEALFNSNAEVTDIGTSRKICIDCQNGMDANGINYNKNNVSGKKSRNRRPGGKYEGTSGNWKTRGCK